MYKAYIQKCVILELESSHRRRRRREKKKMKGKLRSDGELEGKTKTGLDGSKWEGEPQRDSCLFWWYF